MFQQHVRKESGKHQPKSENHSFMPNTLQSEHIQKQESKYFISTEPTPWDLENFQLPRVMPCWDSFLDIRPNQSSAAVLAGPKDLLLSGIIALCNTILSTIITGNVVLSIGSHSKGNALSQTIQNFLSAKLIFFSLSLSIPISGTP